MALDKDYQVLERLGEGAFGKVYKAKHRKSDDVVAVKQIKVGAKSWDEALKSTELAALKQLRHPFIVRLRELIRSTSDGSLYYVFEFIDSDLFRLLRRYPNGLEEIRAAELTRQLFAGLMHIHQCGFFHRDIKPENVLYLSEQQSIRIADFGEARSLRARPPFTDYVGTRWYRAPECLLRDRAYSSPVDNWAAGLVFAELLRGSAVFMGNSSIDQLYKIFTVLGQPDTGKGWPEFNRLAEACRVRVPKEAGCGLGRVLPMASSAALSFVAEILILNPRQRPQARKILEHSYFSQLPPLELERVEGSRPGSAASAHAAGALPPEDTSRPESQRSLASSSVAPSAVPEDGGAPKEAMPLIPEPPLDCTADRSTLSRAPTEVNVEDLDLDAELDKILDDMSPKAAQGRSQHRDSSPDVLQHVGAGTSESLYAAAKQQPAALPRQSSSSHCGGSFNFAPSTRLLPSALEKTLSVPSANVQAAAPPGSPGGGLDALLSDLCADLGVADEQPLTGACEGAAGQMGAEEVPGADATLLPSSHVDRLGGAASPQLSDDDVQASPARLDMHVSEQRQPWTEEECARLRRVVKKVIKLGTRDKDHLWLEVSQQMGGQRKPRDCKLQYARDYKADKAKKAADGLPGDGGSILPGTAH
eukprot:TRINITY_DN29257_c0_g1_i1.p1 TRINITY_DN29257_c0_g1~~TRINITY_DN29257_c0_g1_i1.p1  ORF type:complete len:646 (+),score=138.72 TRINITY_DN29257_c0_g1_i1:52-1989(+)